MTDNSFSKLCCVPFTATWPLTRFVPLPSNPLSSDDLGSHFSTDLIPPSAKILRHILPLTTPSLPKPPLKQSDIPINPHSTPAA
jgi:hypothetical protein